MLAAALLAIPAVAMGCQSTLYRVNDSRTQYDRYDRVRNDYKPPYIEDEYGRLTPNLRGRLLTQQ